MKNLIALLLLCSFVATTSFGQIQTPAPSPLAKVTQNVGLAEITIEYSRPGVKDRTIFGDLVPYGEFWRTGANATTKITFSEDVSIAGKDLKKGTYSLFSFPGKSKWDVIFSTSMSLPGGSGYDASKEAVRVTLPSSQLDQLVETFTINVGNIRNNSATIDLTWENTQVSIPVSLDTDAKVFASIDQVMAGPSAGDYYAAASYYLATGKDLEKAHKWVSKAVEMGNGSQFWIMHTKAKIEAKLGKKEEAIKTAKMSIEAAKAAGNAQYVKFNEDLIDAL